jgi:S-adenosylmethionine-diacylglycerol 3-amino-3-carboxypropyl transferase
MIHYAQCWEDPRLLTQALDITPDDDIISIASGGENSFALLLHNPRSVIAIDRNPEQVFLVELKMRAIQKLEYDDYVAFLGVRESRLRDRLYSVVRLFLSDNARQYWDSRRDDIGRGVIHCGKFERYFSLYRRCILPLIHSRNDVKRLLGGKSLNAQRRFYDDVWNNRRWRWFFRLFFGKLLLSRLGRHPSLFRYVTMENVAAELLRRTAYGLTEVNIEDNYFVEYILTGKYHNLEQVHPSYSEKNFYLCRERIERIQLVNQSLDEYLATLPNESISKFNLSDIFEYMSDVEFEQTLRAIHRVARDSAKMAFWTLFVPREIPAAFKSQFASDGDGGKILHANDRTFFYGGFGIWEAKGTNKHSRVEKHDAHAAEGRIS